MKLHKLKIYPSHFMAIKEGRKNFEVRFDDRHFEVGDQLLLEEFEPKDYWDPEEPGEDRYTGEILHRVITYKLLGGQFGIEAGYVALGIEKL